MSLIRREQRTAWPLDTLWSQELVDTMFGDMFRSVLPAQLSTDRAVERGAHPMRLEEFIEDDTCVVRAELPGIDPEKDVDITISDGVLHLTAQREERQEEKRSDGYRSEFRYGRLSRSIRLPEGVTEDDVTASYTDGILEVRMPAPKAPVAATPTKIAVTRG